MENGMPKIHKKPCPLCGQEAEWMPKHFGRRRKFKCPKCNIFLISLLLEETIIEISKTKKEKISKKSASCGENMMLHIYRKDDNVNLECVLESSWY